MTEVSDIFQNRDNSAELVVSRLDIFFSRRSMEIGFLFSSSSDLAENKGLSSKDVLRQRFENVCQAVAQNPELAQELQNIFADPEVDLTKSILKILGTIKYKSQNQENIVEPICLSDDDQWDNLICGEVLDLGQEEVFPEQKNKLLSK